MVQSSQQSSLLPQDHAYMAQALKIAEKAAQMGEVPVAALIVDNDKILSQTHNQVQTTHQATAHAELLALQQACRQKKEKYLPNATLYVTLEPCPMCAMAASWCQIQRIVYAAPDPKRGYTRFQPSLLFPKIKVTQGLLAPESTSLLQNFFQQLRAKK